MFKPLKDSQQFLSFWRLNRGLQGDYSPMFEAVKYVTSQDYPLRLFGSNYSFGLYRITTSKTEQIKVGDWKIQFFWTPEGNYFHFSMWVGTERGILAIPRRECELDEFNAAIDELIEQMSDGSLLEQYSNF